MSREILWAGPRSFLIQCTGLSEVMALHATLISTPLAGQVEVLAAAETVLVSFGDAKRARAGAEAVAQLEVAGTDAATGRTVTIETVYSGEDLEEVAELTGLGVEGVVNWHTETSWLTGFGGFAPGFSYLVPQNAAHALEIPRRSEPRTAVPAGAVGLAGTFSAVYPRRSPGGWQLIGNTTQPMWDLSQDSPALLSPGDTVRFVAVHEQASVTQLAPAQAEPVSIGLRIDDPGMLTLIQDAGRAGHGDLGVPASGAADWHSARRANQYLGNDIDQPVLEILLGGTRLTALGHQVLALAGATTPASIHSPDGTIRAAGFNRPFGLYDGESLVLNAPTAGLRTYVGVRGGLDVEKVLGSASTDTLSGLGPAPLQAGDTIPVHTVPAMRPVDIAPLAYRERLPTTSTPTRLRVIPGPRSAWFSERGTTDFAEQLWKVSPRSDRIGVRLEAARPVEYAADFQGAELASEGMVAGAIQVPPGGQPVLFLADHPVTGGYPVISVVHPDDLRFAAQLPPGAEVQFIFDPQEPAHD